MSCKKSAFILGACTPIGRKLIETLNQCSEYNNIVLMGQRAVDNLPVTSKLVQRIINYEKLEDFVEHFENLNVGFCALGTAKTKSEAEGCFNLEIENIVKTARLAKDKGTKTFILVSMAESPGFIENSEELEAEIAKLDFKKTLILRPGALDDTDNDAAPQGHENELDDKDEGIGEDSDRNSNTVTYKDVARAMVVGSLDSNITGTVTWNSEKIVEKAPEFSI